MRKTIFTYKGKAKDINLLCRKFQWLQLKKHNK